ncbi:hypothetical protein HDE76_001266 [Rhodanobacter sp. ANJX3]|uniref:hypothetical protein n=1 Tax=Rhodanobacter sp. ANJX3 TaxID=2723083 RepID=UPI0016152364|nr:hypothetical protein [Rhodanobacter sp. ANJX3]MBB5358060.1 hypothetical protein [Rhodanobacter sp. ANJX3]
MIHTVWDWMRFNFWFGLLCLTAGLIIMVPLLLSKSFRARFLRSNWDLGVIGVVILAIVLLAVGIYNHLGANGV